MDSSPEPDGQTPGKWIGARLVLEIVLTCLTFLVFAIFPSDWTIVVLVSACCVALIVIGLVHSLRKDTNSKQ